MSFKETFQWSGEGRSKATVPGKVSYLSAKESMEREEQVQSRRRPLVSVPFNNIENVYTSFVLLYSWESFKAKGEELVEGKQNKEARKRKAEIKKMAQRLLGVSSCLVYKVKKKD